MEQAAHCQRSTARPTGLRNAAAHVRFDTAAVPRADRFEYWRERVRPLTLEPVGTARQDFQVSAEVLHSGDVDVIEMFRGPALARWRQTDGQQQGRLRLILLAPAPGGVASWYGHPAPLDRGAAIIAGATDGWWRTPAGLHGIQVDVPRGAIPLTDAALAQIRTGQRLARDPVFHTLLRPMLSALPGRLAPLAATGGPALGAAWISLITMLAQSLSGCDLDGADIATARRIQAERYIDDHLGDVHLTPAAVAAALHLSRRALYSTVFAEGGVAHYIRARRMDRAYQLLATTTLSVAEIAGTVGIPGPAHFSRLFRSTYDISPREAAGRSARRNRR